MAAIKNFIAGTAYIYVDGRNYLLRGDFQYRPTTVERKSLVGMDKVHGFSEQPAVGMIKGKMSDAGDLRVGDFNKMRDVTVVAELANGKTIIGRNMWTTEAQPTESTEGTVEVTWEGPDVTEQLS